MKVKSLTRTPKRLHLCRVCVSWLNFSNEDCSLRAQPGVVFGPSSLRGCALLRPAVLGQEALALLTRTGKVTPSYRTHSSVSNLGGWGLPSLIFVDKIQPCSSSSPRPPEEGRDEEMASLSCVPPRPPASISRQYKT